jgi:hypothetical protein
MNKDFLEDSLKKKFAGLSDFSIRYLNDYQIYFISSLVKVENVNRFIIYPILDANHSKDGILFPVDNMQKDTSIEQAVTNLLRGSIIVSHPQDKYYLSISIPSDTGRSIEPSDQEATLYTPLEGFTEQLEPNLTLIRRFLPIVDLKSEIFEVGELSKSKVALLHIEGLANPDELQSIKEKLKRVNAKFIMNSSFLSRLLEDSPKSSFPQFKISDKPDFASYALSLGKIVIMVDQNPFVIIGPISFFDFFLSSEDYIHNAPIAFFIRGIRLIGYFTSLLLVPIYVAITTFHYEALPLELLFIVTESRSQVPFPPFLESVLIILILEFLKEASKRMPAKTGNTLGVVGGIIIGDAAVQAGLASNILIVMVGIMAVSSFLVPNYLMGVSSKIIRIFLLVLSHQLGLFGVIAGFCLLIIHLNSIYSLKKPYLIPKLRG